MACAISDWAVVLQYCGVAVIETKNRAMSIVAKVEQQLDIPKKVRIHWTGCPNSCGQVSTLALPLFSSNEDLLDCMQPF